MHELTSSTSVFCLHKCSVSINQSSTVIIQHSKSLCLSQYHHHAQLHSGTHSTFIELMVTYLLQNNKIHHFLRKQGILFLINRLQILMLYILLNFDCFQLRFLSRYSFILLLEKEGFQLLVFFLR